MTNGGFLSEETRRSFLPMRLIFCLGCLLVITGCAKPAADRRLVVAATTSLEDTGLLDALAAEFRKTHPEIDLVPISVGTGQAIELGRRGDADVLITHDSVAETKLVADGVAKTRQSLMYNDFIIAGPADDPAGVRGRDATAALRAIAQAGAAFTSRGDDSGTHRREMKLWGEAGIVPTGNGWYIEAGLGQGDALVLASQKRAYLLSDRATYLRFKPRLNLEILGGPDARLINNYAVTVLNGERERLGLLFADWLVSREVQALIGEFGRAEFGQSLFNPSAHGAVLHDTIPTGER
jgi:tungstate transport system substrate-binding protein